MELPNRLAILPFRNQVLLPGAIVKISCNSSRRFFNFVCIFVFEFWAENSLYYCFMKSPPEKFLFSV